MTNLSGNFRIDL